MSLDNTIHTETQANNNSHRHGQWVDAYVDWAAKRSPLTPPHFHEGIAYSLAACAIAGRICVQTPQGRIYPNLYTLLLGKTSVYAKSVAMDLSQEVAEAAKIQNRVINSVFTPESVIGELAGDKPTNLKDLSEEVQGRWTESAKWGACRMFRLDEAGMFFNGLQRDYNAGLADLWMKLYDCPPTVERTTYKHGLHVIQRPVLSCLFATTPASIGKLLRNQAMWLQGFWPRWNFCVGGGYPDFTQSSFAPAPPTVYEPLSRLGNNLLGRWTADDPFVVPVDPEVFEDYEITLETNRQRIFANEDGYMEAALGRLHTKRLKLALILTALHSETPEQLRVTNYWWQLTANSVRQMELDMVEALRQVANTEKAGVEERIICFLKRNHGQATVRAIQRHMHMAMCELAPYLTSAKDACVCEILAEGKSTVVRLILEA